MVEAVGSGVEASGKTLSEIEDAAGNVSKKLGYVPGVDDIRDIIDADGGQVVISDGENLRDMSGGAMTVYEGGSYIIFLSPVTGVLRDNFTIAHELGHLCLHVSNEKKFPVTVNRYGNDLAEREANSFAAAFLMPLAEFAQVAKEVDSNVDLLAGRFKVSRQAAGYRLNAVK